MEAQIWPWNERINSLFLYDTNGVLYLKCVWFIFACFINFVFIIICLDLDDNLYGSELLQQSQESINRVTGNSSSLCEKWPQKMEKNVIIMIFHFMTYFTVIDTFFTLWITRQVS